MPYKIMLTITFFSTKKPKKEIIPTRSFSTSSLTSLAQRSYFKLDQTVKNHKHLDALILTNANGTISFENLIPYIQTANPYWIPSTWPTPIDQRGYCCGLYALEIALKYAHPNEAIPPARKNGDPSRRSLRQMAKEKGYSAFGEIFNVMHLQEVAENAGYSSCKALKFKCLSYTSYRNKICFLLRAGYSVIVSCDLGGANDTPGDAKGLEAHWALVFGYFYFNDHCYFLATQYGKYFIWSATTLYESNLTLPEHNPRSGPLHVYHKNKQSGEEFFIQVNHPLPSKNKVRYCLTETLTDFQFTVLATSTPALNKSLYFDKTRTPLHKLIDQPQIKLI